MRVNHKNSQTLVLLDFGHGEETPGKRSPVWPDGSQLFEWKFNRDVGTLLMGYLHLVGISYGLVVTSPKDIPLYQRVATINRLVEENKDKYKYIYGVSIHGNAFSSPNARGIEVFSCKADNGSDDIADVYYRHLAKLGWRMRPGDKRLGREADFYIIRERNVDCDMILTENGFFTNREECKKMLDFKWQQRIANAHLKAALEIEREYKHV